MKLVEQWRAVETRLPDEWASVRLVLTTEEPGRLAEAAQVLAPLVPGRRGDELVVSVRRAGGGQGPEAARRLFARLDSARIWCRIEQEAVDVREEAAAGVPAAATAPSTVESWDAQCSMLPVGWSDLLCEIELASSDHLPRAALLCAPLNPTRVGGRLAFTFRCSGADGYGASAGMARRCFERLDAEGLTGAISVLRVLSDVDNVATQGAVWLVGGRAL